MYEQIQVTAFDCTCERCGYSWTSHKEQLPTHCANRHCTNPTKWNTPGESRQYENRKTAPVVSVTSAPVVDQSEWIDIGEHWNEITGEMVAMERHYKTGQTREK